MKMKTRDDSADPRYSVYLLSWYKRVKVQVLTLVAHPCRRITSQTLGSFAGCYKNTCFTGTKILTQKALVAHPCRRITAQTLVSLFRPCCMRMTRNLTISTSILCSAEAPYPTVTSPLPSPTRRRPYSSTVKALVYRSLLFEASLYQCMRSSVTRRLQLKTGLIGEKSNPRFLKSFLA